ncbi:MAG: putative type transporter superfamily [Chthonomonadales bacterium]|nr:putative type transporter superfamily [Chthonomonadales bacterium]
MKRAGSEAGHLEQPESSQARKVSERIEAPDENSHESMVVYTAFSRHGFATWIEMVRELYLSRELTWRLFLRDFAARYRQSFLGYIWAIVPSLVMVATFSWLNRTRVLPIGATILPYPVFVLLGMTVWQLFAGGLTSTTQSLVSAGSIITKINFPRETLVLAAFGQSLFEFLLRLALLAGAFALYRVVPAWTILFLPLILIPLCLLTLGLGFICALINGVFRDAGQMVTFVLTFWMFLTPVVYPAPPGDALTLMHRINPVSPFLIAAQDLATRGALSQPGNFAIGCVISLLVFLVGWRLFHVSEPRIAERI